MITREQLEDWKAHGSEGKGCCQCCTACLYKIGGDRRLGELVEALETAWKEVAELKREASECCKGSGSRLEKLEAVAAAAEKLIEAYEDEQRLPREQLKDALSALKELEA